MKKKVVNIILAVLVSLLFIWIGYTSFFKSYIRLKEVFIDLGKSLKLFYCVITNNFCSEDLLTYNNSRVMKNVINLSKTPSGFKKDFIKYFKLFFDKENLFLYLKKIGKIFFKCINFIVLVLPFVILLIFLIKIIYNRENNNFGKETVFLKVYKFISKNIFLRLKKVIVTFTGFVNENSFIKKIWLVIWLLNFNVFSIILGVFAFYFKILFLLSFDLLYQYFYSFILDCQMFFNIYGLIFLISFVIIQFKKIREKRALQILRHLEARNCGFINELPIVSMTVGSMGKKKTTLITDMALSQEVMFRQKALEILTENDLKFPYFSWVLFEKDLENVISYGQVYNLATVKEWVNKKRKRFNGNSSKIYNYDYKRYGLYYYDGLKQSDLFDILTIYAEAYFLYIIESSLIISNYSVRTDNLIESAGNFPLWVTDFFIDKGQGRHSHILDFDILRLGRKVIEKNKNIGSFEFGVVLITEIGKERGNNLELKEVKKNNDETNQKNDLFNSWLKMCRHSATIEGFPFVKVFTDEQRPESWGADARDLCDIVHIIDSGDLKIALPFYILEEMFTEWIFNFFVNMYRNFRFKRGDNTLFVYLLKKFTCFFYNRYKRVINKYGYRVIKLETERGTQDGLKSKKRYYLMNKKIYSNRFSTDCFSDYFNVLAKKSKVGLNDYVEYESEKATVDELKKQNSYFVSGLYRN